MSSAAQAPAPSWEFDVLSFTCSGCGLELRFKEELAGITHCITLLLEIEPREVILLGKHLDQKFDELLSKLEARMGADGDVKTG